MTDDKFFERLRADAASLRHQPDDFALSRIRARIRAEIDSKPGVAQLLAAWFRPLAVTLTAVAIAAAIGLSTADPEDTTYTDEPVEIVMAGDTYRVGE